MPCSPMKCPVPNKDFCIQAFESERRSRALKSFGNHSAIMSMLADSQIVSAPTVLAPRVDALTWVIG